MSVVTKVFVVLLVVSSLLLSAAVVVFVNRVEDYKKSYLADVAQVKALSSQSSILSNALQDKQKEKEKVEEDRLKDLAAKETEIAALNKRSSDKDSVIADLNKEKNISAAEKLVATQNVNAALAQVKTQSETTTAVRGQLDTVVKQFHDLNVGLSDKENKIRALTKQVEYSEEVIADLQNQVKMLRERAPQGAGGVASNQGSSSPGTTPRADGSVPDIKGVVREVSMISGKKYATISVGSSSAVTKGMRFTVVNRQTGDFLGYVTIDNVQPDEAIGQVDGPQVDKIQAGVDVRTQL